MIIDITKAERCEDIVNLAFIKICKKNFIYNESLRDKPVFVPLVGINEIELLMVVKLIEEVYGIEFKMSDFEKCNYITFNSLVEMTKFYVVK